MRSRYPQRGARPLPTQTRMRAIALGAWSDEPDALHESRTVGPRSRTEGDEQAQTQHHDVAGRLRRRPGPKRGEPARRRRDGAARVGLPAQGVPARCTASREARSTPALPWSRSAGQTSAPRSWAATCSGRFAVRGRTSPGGAGGARIRPTTIRCSCSPTTRASHSRWRAAPPSTSSATGSSRRSRRPRTPRRDGTSGWRAAHRSSTSTWPQRLVDEIDVSIAPLILGAGARLFEGLDRGTVELEQIRAVDAPGVTHIKYRVSRSR